MELVPLSRYKGQLVRIYSVKNGDEALAWSTADQLLSDHVKYEGLRGWNYVLRILPVLFKYWLLHGPKRIPWNKLPNVDSPDRVNCLVMIRRCYPNLISDAVCASAGAFEQAFLDGKMIIEQEGIVP